MSCHMCLQETECEGTSSRLIAVIVIYSFYVLTMLGAGFVTHALVRALAVYQTLTHHTYGWYDRSNIQ
jgi:hypothetical protein